MIDYRLLPGREKKEYGKLIDDKKVVISIITPFYNGGATLQETANCIFNQTYPYFEWIIVDDGSKDKDSLKELERVAKLDKRIKVFHKENAGPSVARDFGISQSSKESKYIFFIDCDDLMENNMIECLFWALETHADASWSYTAMTNFGDSEFIWDRYLSARGEKKENVIGIASLVNKDDLIEVGCFGIKEKSMYEDWNLWLKLLEAGKKPVRINAPLFWYRISNFGELSRAKKNHKNAMKYVNETAKKVSNNAEVYQFPSFGDKDITPDNFNVDNWKNFILPMYKKTDKKTILYIFPWMVVGGADLFNLELIKRLDKNKYNAIVLTTFPRDNPLRQQFVENSNECYDMSTFLERKDYIQFVEYLIKSRNVDIVFNSNSTYGYAMLPHIKAVYHNIKVIDYIHSVDLKDPRGAFGRYSKDFEECIDHTYACNEFTTNQLKDMFGINHVDTIYIGTDSDKYDPSKFDRKKLRRQYGISEDEKVITFIARLSEEKRPELFVKVADLLLKERGDLSFIIAGDGPLFNDVKKLIEHKGISDKFRMLGMVKNSAEVYSISDLTFNCSRLEGLALTAYESLAMGVPVVSSDVGGQKELIDDTVGKIVDYKENLTNEEKNQEIVDYKNAVLCVLDNLDKLKKNSRKKILNGFTVENMVEKFDSIFDTLEANDSVIPESLALSVYKLYMEYLFDEYQWFVYNYCVDHYPGFNDKFFNIDKDKLWKYPAWRAFVKSPAWKIGKKIFKRD